MPRKLQLEDNFWNYVNKIHKKLTATTVFNCSLPEALAPMSEFNQWYYLLLQLEILDNSRK